MERADLASVLSTGCGLAEYQLERLRVLARENPDLDPRPLLYRLLGEGVLGAQDLNVSLGALLARERPDIDLTGRSLGRYRLLERLGPPPGGSSYRAEPAGAVVKVLPRDLSENRLRETAGRLARTHPNLAAVLDSGVADGVPFLAVAHRPGRTLRDAELPRAGEGIQVALRWGHETARAVETLHRRGLVHGSLGPDDFIVGPDGVVTLADLGVLSLDPHGPLRKAFGQGAAFAAPEVLLGRPPDARADLFSLGVILHGVLARKPLFEALTPGALLQRRLQEKPAADPLLRAGVPPPVAAAVLKLLEPDPEKRPDGLAPLAAALAGSPVPQEAPPPPRPAPRPPVPRRPAPPPNARAYRLLLLASTMVLLASLAVVLAILTVRKQPPPAAVVLAPTPPPPPPQPDPEPPRPATPSDRGPERLRLLALARDAERTERTEEAVRLYREASAIASDPLVEEKIRDLEARLRERSREEADAEQVRKAVAVLPAEAALQSCDDFLARWPRSRHAEEFLQTKRELVVRLRETARPREEAAPKPAPAPSRPPPEPKASPPGVPGRALDPSIRDALVWLARHQDPDGGWSVTGHAARCAARGCLPNVGHDAYGPGVTALAVLAVLGAGIGWHDQDEYEGRNLGETLRRGAGALLAMNGDGAIGGKGRSKYVYNHALATHALSEAVRSAHDIRTSEDPALVSLREGHADAVDFLLAAQNPASGWRYSARCGDNDTSVTATAFIALESAKAAGAAVAPTALPGAVRWFESVTEEPLGRAGYTHKGTGKVFVPGMNQDFDHHETLTAAAWTCRQRLGNAPAGGARRALELLLRDLPDTRPLSADYYYWYHGTRLVKEVGDAGQRARWKDALLAALEAARPADPGGCARGSWEPRDRWAGEGGRVYAVAINALTLEHALLPRPFEYPRRVAPAPLPAAAEARFVFVLKTGGQVRAVSYEEVEDKYVLQLAAGRSVIPKESVRQIQKIPAKESP